MVKVSVGDRTIDLTCKTPSSTSISLLRSKVGVLKIPLPIFLNLVLVVPLLNLNSVYPKFTSFPLVSKAIPSLPRFI